MSPMEAIVPLCLPMWLHFGHIWPHMSDFGPLCPFLASIGTTYGPLYTTLGPIRSQLGLNGTIIESKGALIGPYGTWGDQMGIMSGGIQ
jgi:hypothetical protein